MSLGKLGRGTHVNTKHAITVSINKAKVDVDLDKKGFSHEHLAHSKEENAGLEYSSQPRNISKNIWSYLFESQTAHLVPR